MLKEMEEQMIRIKTNLNTTHDKHKRYVDKGKTTRYFRVGDHVYLEVRPKKSSLKLGICPKLAPKYCGPF